MILIKKSNSVELNDYKYIAFMYPVTSGVMGGVQKLIVSLISFYSRVDVKVRLYDYDHGLIKQTLDALEVYNYDFVSLEGEHSIIRNKGNEIFILTGSLSIKYPLSFENKNVGVVAWDVYTPEWYNFDKIKKKITFRGLRHDFFKLVYENEAIIFMEESGVNYFNSELKNECFSNDKIIPVCLDKEKYRAKPKSNYNTSDLCIGYIGRAVDWKIKPLNFLIDKLEELKINGCLPVNVKIKVVTNDRQVFSQLLGESRIINVNIVDNITGSDLDDIIYNEFDMGYSMGISALEIAKFGIPTILADFSKKDFNENYKFRWLLNSTGSSLGQDISNQYDYDESRMSISQILLDYQDNFNHLSGRTREYVETNHSLPCTANKVIYLANKSSLKASDFNGVYYLFYKLYYSMSRRLKSSDLYWGWGIK